MLSGHVRRAPSFSHRDLQAFLHSSFPVDNHRSHVLIQLFQLPSLVLDSGGWHCRMGNWGHLKIAVLDSDNPNVLERDHFQGYPRDPESRGAHGPP